MKVEFLWWSGCPSSDEALADLRAELDAHGLDPAAVAVREIESDREAEAVGFPGSPTIRIDGADVVDPGPDPVGLTCRVYRLRDGRYSPVPDRADIADALAAASAEGVD